MWLQSSGTLCFAGTLCGGKVQLLLRINLIYAFLFPVKYIHIPKMYKSLTNSSLTYFIKTCQSLIAEIPRQSVFTEHVPAPYKLCMWLNRMCSTATGKKKFKKKYFAT